MLSDVLHQPQARGGLDRTPLNTALALPQITPITCGYLHYAAIPTPSVAMCAPCWSHPFQHTPQGLYFRPHPLLSSVSIGPSGFHGRPRTCTEVVTYCDSSDPSQHSYCTLCVPGHPGHVGHRRRPHSHPAHHLAHPGTAGKGVQPGLLHVSDQGSCTRGGWETTFSQVGGPC